MANVLEVKNLHKKFNNFEAVKNISLNLEEGQILGLLGPNGAGKTTTIQMLLGVMTPTQGSITYFGKDLKTHRSEILEKVSFSSTYVYLPIDLTVKEILTYTSYLYDIKDRKQVINEIVELFKLKKILDKPIKNLSAGQETRVNLAKAFINKPKIILLDEPTASLDPDIADYIRKFLKEQQRDRNMSILFTSHNMAEVTELCDRVIFINNGQIISNDTPENLARSIKNTTLELKFEKDITKVSHFLDSKKINYEIDNDWINIDIHELKIPDVLEFLIKNDFKYTEINIEKPTLEDYFLNFARKNES